MIRIRFPDRKDLQGYFYTDECTEDIYAFVGQCCALFIISRVCVHVTVAHCFHIVCNPDVPFYLYTSPPKQKLPATQTLLQQRMVPAAMIYIGFENNLTSCLTDQLLATAIAAPSPTPVKYVAAPASTPAAAATAAEDEEDRKVPRLPPQPAPAPVSKLSGQQLPKWFNVAKKH